MRDEQTPSLLSLWGPVALYCAAIFALSSISDVPDMSGVPSDKVLHALLYSGLGFLVSRALSRGSRWPWPLLVLAFTAFYGLTDEIHQLFVPGRRFELADLAADLTGAAVGAAVFWLWSIIARTTWARSR